MNKYPVVYIYKSNQDNGLELSRSIRSLKNLVNWNGQVIVSGNSERWFHDIVHIPTTVERGNPYQSAQQKILDAIRSPLVPDKFILMMDDIYFTRPFAAGVYHQGELPTDPGRGYHNAQKHRTRQWLEERNLPVLDYELHYPFIVEKDKLQQVHNHIWKTMNGVSLKMKSVYFNLFPEPCEQVVDHKTKTTELPDGDVISTQYYTDELDKLFPEPSRFEHEKKYTVSVVIPVYNQEKRIITALNSIPDHPQIKEIIVYDDKSTDNTIESIQRYKQDNPDKPIRLLEATENKGVGFAFNRLLDHVTQDYILRLDSDDYLLPEMSQVIDMLDGSDIVYYNLAASDGLHRQVTPHTRAKFIAHTHLFKTLFVGDTRTIETNWGEDRHFVHALQAKRPSELYTNITAHFYNDLVEGGLTYNRRKNKLPKTYAEYTEPITLSLFTNCHKDCTTNPTIFNTYESYVKTFGKPDYLNIYCDPNPHQDDYETYAKQIKDYFGQEPVKTGGLADGYFRSLQTARTEYLFQLEADWEFVNVINPLNEILGAMKHDWLWFMLFNQHKNVHDPRLAKWQTYLKPQNQLYCYSDRVSNNPHIIQVRHYNEHIAPLIDWTIPGCGRIEEVLEKKHQIAIYGEYGKEPTIIHTDSRRGERKI